jgi:hypothetical protein
MAKYLSAFYRTVSWTFFAPICLELAQTKIPCRADPSIKLSNFQGLRWRLEWGSSYVIDPGQSLGSRDPLVKEKTLNQGHQIDARGLDIMLEQRAATRGNEFMRDKEFPKFRGYT